MIRCEDEFHTLQTGNLIIINEKDLQCKICGLEYTINKKWGLPP